MVHTCGAGGGGGGAGGARLLLVKVLMWPENRSASFDRAHNTL